MKREPKKKISSVYRPKALIPGYKIEEGLTGFYAAVPDRNFKKKPFKIVYTATKVVEGKGVATLLVKEVESWLKAEKFRRFPDRWGRGVYTLGYFKMTEIL